MSNKEPIFRPGLLVLSIDQCGTNSIIGTYAKFPKKHHVTFRVTVRFEIKNVLIPVKDIAEELAWLRENFGKHFEASHKNAIIVSTVTP